MTDGRDQGNGSLETIMAAWNSHKRGRESAQQASRPGSAIRRYVEAETRVIGGEWLVGLVPS